jgi:hypothetical protein
VLSPCINNYSCRTAEQLVPLIAKHLPLSVLLSVANSLFSTGLLLLLLLLLLIIVYNSLHAIHAVCCCRLRASARSQQPSGTAGRCSSWRR